MRKWMPLVAVCLGTFMLLLDVTIVNVALPDMSDDLHTSLGALQWVVDGYALALAALLLGVGALADRLGHRRTYLAGLVVFVLASLACGLSPNPATIIVFRVVQGVGGAAMIATTFALLNRSYSGRDRGIAYGMWGAVSGASSAVGPLLGGPLTEFLSWRWIFFVNIPVTLVALVISVLALQESDVQRRRVDVPGVVLFSAAIGLLTFGMIDSGSSGWGSPSCWVPLCAGALLLVVFAVVESRLAEPLLEPALLRNKIFGGVLVVALLLNVTAYVSLTYSSIWVQSTLGLSPVIAGLVALPMSGAAFVVSASLGSVMPRLRSDWVIGIGMLLVGIGDLLGFVLVHVMGSWPALLPGFFVVGLGIGLATPPLSSAGTAAVPAERGGMAGGAIYTARQAGFAFGIALLGGVFTAGAHQTLAGRHVASAGSVAHDITGARTADVLRSAAPGARAALTDAVHAAAANGMALLLVVVGVVGIVAAVVSFVMLRPRAASTGPDASADGIVSRDDRTGSSGRALTQP